jgi:acyl dehydratase
VSTFGTTIAHGFLTLSLLPRLLADLYEFTGFTFDVSYGLNRLAEMLVRLYADES